MGNERGCAPAAVTADHLAGHSSHARSIIVEGERGGGLEGGGGERYGGKGGTGELRGQQLRRPAATRTARGDTPSRVQHGAFDSE